MEYAPWKKELLQEIEAAAMRQTQVVPADAEEATAAARSQAALLRLADNVRAMPESEAHLVALFSEESEIERLETAPWGEAERRCRDAKEDLLAAIGDDPTTFASADDFLDAIRNYVDEIISEYRLVPVDA